ncbi:MAG: iron export ABC transporter permease subunit FetB [Candidatus Izemoplasma sp.]|nr:iron export ABC transporter permease subunit FetB [Candidatus Izemoplasma sp.]
MNNGIIEIGYYQLAIAYIFIIIILFLMKRRHISREKELFIATVRMTAQLILVGYILAYILNNPHPLISLGVILLMVTFAIYTVFSKFKGQLSRPLKHVIAFALFAGTLPVLMFFTWAVIGIEPYYNPQYLIPLTGMIIGNSMTGISLGIKTLVEGFTTQKDEVVEALILGASAKEASNNIINSAFDSAIMPTINSMLGMGIIFLPGMMTGQILSGVDPRLSVLYQIAIMLGILGGVSLTTYIALIVGYKTYFNHQVQLIDFSYLDE